MKSYRITLPAFTRLISAPNQEEALEQFWFDFGAAQYHPDWDSEPIIKEFPNEMDTEPFENSSEALITS